MFRYLTPKDQTPVDLNMSEGPRYCNICDYEAEDGYQLDAHVWSDHDDDVEEDLPENNQHIIGCNICEEKFENMRDLMKHKKKEHSDRVAMCWKFASGNCIYGDTDCWFQHYQTEGDTEPAVNCNLCEKDFRCKTDLLRHRKTQHRQQVPRCRHEKNGNCIFGRRYCWFIHENLKTGLENENIEEEIEENSDVIQKVFGMLETMTERIMKMEKCNIDKMETA